MCIHLALTQLGLNDCAALVWVCVRVRVCVYRVCVWEGGIMIAYIAIIAIIGLTIFFRIHIVGIDTVLKIWIVFIVVSLTVCAVWLAIAPRVTALAPRALLLTV